MGYKLSKNNINDIFEQLSEKYVIYAPKLFEGEGIYSDTDRVRYGKIKAIDDIVFNKRQNIHIKKYCFLFHKHYFSSQKIL